MKLSTISVEKPWGRTGLSPPFAQGACQRIGEVWFDDPRGDAADLMVKYLFTTERLSIQVHPDDTLARNSGFARGKDECWYVVDAEPGATVGMGLVRDCTPDDLRAAALNGEIERLVRWHPVRAGDFLYNPAGIIHALGAGLTVIELQQNVDCTYRLYDYGRPRELHLDEGVAASNLSATLGDVVRAVPLGGTVTLVAGPKFSLVRAEGPTAVGSLTTGNAPCHVVPLKGECRVDEESVAFGECALTLDVRAISLAEGAQALIGWPL